MSIDRSANCEHLACLVDRQSRALPYNLQAIGTRQRKTAVLTYGKRALLTWIASHCPRRIRANCTKTNTIWTTQ